MGVPGLPEGYTLEAESTPPPQPTTTVNNGGMNLPEGYTLEQPDQPEPSTYSMGAAAISSPDTISTGPEGSNSDQQLMSEASQKSATKGGLIAGAAGAAALGGIAAAPTVSATAATMLPAVVDTAKAVVEWAKANPLKSYAIGQMADQLGIHPFDLMHAAVKYGKSLFGDSEPTKE